MHRCSGPTRHETAQPNWLLLTGTGCCRVNYLGPLHAPRCHPEERTRRGILLASIVASPRSPHAGSLAVARDDKELSPGMTRPEGSRLYTLQQPVPVNSNQFSCAVYATDPAMRCCSFGTRLRTACSSTIASRLTPSRISS